MKRMFPRHAGHIVVSPSNRVFDIVTDLYKKGTTEITMVVGSDRVREFETTLKRYNDIRSRHGYYNFDKINIVSAGERDPDAEGATGMSASKMRAAAKKDDFESFKKGLPSSFARTAGAQDLFKSLRRGMNLAASVNPDAGAGALRFKPFITASTKEDLDNMLLRDKYLTEHLYEIGDIVDDVSNSITGIIVRRGTNYVTLEDANMKLHKAWLYDIIETPVYPVKLEERARELKYDKETDQPKKYVKGLSDKEKKAHDRHLEKQGKKSDSDPSAYKQSPADKVAKTKPSKYTKRFKQMYGELKLPKDKEETEKMNMGIHTGMPETYDIGHDYALANAKITPGEPQYDPNYQGSTYKPSKPEDNNKQVSDRKISTMIKSVELKDIEEWISSDETIDKYKERYGEEWQSKLDETYDKMINKLVDRSDNIVESRIKEFARDLTHLNNEQFKLKHGRLKEEIRKEIGTTMQVKTFKEFQDIDTKCEECIFEHEQEPLQEAEYQGKKVKLNDPFRTSGGPKKFSVYVKNEKGNVVKVNFGDPNMEIKRDDPDRRKNFRARHNCDNPGPKWKARYWSCYQWRAGAKVEN